MARKAFRVQVELEIQSVTCPGVWLCPSGKVSLQMYMLDSCIQTAPQPPVFPFHVNERFIFYKTFDSVHRLCELQKAFNREYLYAELIQWQDCEVGNVLSTFETSLSDLLFPSSCDVDLLMEPSTNFPGIIAPKIEICTKTTIDEVCTSDKQKTSCYVVNPKTLQSREPKNVQNFHQKKVCHSLRYHRQRLCDKEKQKSKKPFLSRVKVDEFLINRKVQGVGTECPCDTKKKNRAKKPLNRAMIAKSILSPRKSHSDEEFLRQNMKPNFCRCTEGHVQPDCRICDNYNKKFKNFACACPAGVHPMYSRTHPFPRQIRNRSKTPCKKCLGESKSRNSSWCPYYGTTCTCKDLSQRLKSLSDKLYDKLSSNGCVALEKYSRSSDENDDCDSVSDELESCKCTKNYSAERKKFTDFLDSSYDALFRKIKTSYDQVCRDECECCDY